jgi:hypothetical protein
MKASKLSPDVDPVVRQLAQNPNHIAEYFALDRKAISALRGHLDTGAVRREADAFLARMEGTYGRTLKGGDFVLANLLSAASKLHTSMAAAQTQEIEVPTPEESPVSAVTV